MAEKPSRWKRFIWFLERAVGAADKPGGSRVAGPRGHGEALRNAGTME